MLEKIGEAAVAKEWITPAQLGECQKIVEEARSNGREIALADVLIIKGYLTPKQVSELGQPAVLSPAPAPAPLPSTLGPYEVLDRITTSDSGALYKAKKDDRVCAVRIFAEGIDGEAVRRDAKARVALAHPNLVKHTAFGKIEGSFFSAMEFIEGVTIQDRVLDQGPVPPQEVAIMGHQLAGALSLIHASSLLHGAIRPARILIQSDGSSKLLEFALKRGGKPSPYKSPEENEAKGELDIRSDIYSLGATLYFMVTGTAPFEGTPRAELAAAQRAGSPEPATEWKILQSVIKKMMAPNPDERFETPEQIIEALNPLVEAPKLEVAPKPIRRTIVPPKAEPNPVSKHKIWILSGSAAAAFLLLMILIPKLTSRPASVVTPRENAPVVDEKARIAEKVASLCREGKVDQALAVIQTEASGFSEEASLDLYMLVRDHVFKELETVATPHIKSGAYAKARAELRAFRERMKAIPDVSAAVDRELKRVDADEKQNNLHRVAEEQTRIMGVITPLVESKKYDEAIQKCRESMAVVADSDLKLFLEVQIAGIEARKITVQPPSTHADISSELRDAREAIQSRDWQQGLIVLNRALEADPRSPQALGLRAVCHLELGKNSDASRDASLTMSMNPGSPDALYVLGALTQSVNPNSALDYFTKSIANRPDFASAFLRRALCHLSIGQDEPALNDANEAIRLDPLCRKQGLPILVEAYTRTGNVDKAIEACHEWSKLDANDNRPKEALAGLMAKKPKVIAKTPEPKPAAAPPPPAAKPKPAPKPNPRETAKAERERREQVRKKLQDHFKAFQKKVDLLDDGRYRVQLAYDFSLDKDKDKQFEDFKLLKGTRLQGSVELKSPDLEDPASLIWVGKIRGDFFMKSEYVVTDVHPTQVAGVFLRTAARDEAKEPGEGVGIRLVNISAIDLSEWIIEIVKLAERVEVLSDKKNPKRVRHNARDKCVLTMQRDALTLSSKYGNSSLAGTAEGPDPNYIRMAVYASTIRLTRFEVIAFLDPEYVNKIVPPPPTPTVEETKQPTKEAALNPLGALWDGASLDDWAVAGPAAVAVQDSKIVIDASDSISSVVYQGAKFEKKAAIDVKFKVDLMGEKFLVGMGLVASGGDVFVDGNLLVEMRDYGDKMAMSLVVMENGKPKVLDSRAVEGARLRPGDYALTFLFDNDKATVQLGGMDVLTGALPSKGPFRVGLWTQKGKVRVSEVSSR